MQCTEHYMENGDKFFWKTIICSPTSSINSHFLSFLHRDSRLVVSIFHEEEVNVSQAMEIKVHARTPDALAQFPPKTVLNYGFAVYA